MADILENQQGTTQKTGYAFVSNHGVISSYSSGPVNAVKVYEVSDNIYISGPVTQTTNMVISGPAKIMVYDEQDNVVEDVSRRLNRMFSQPNCSITSCARSSISDLIIWGLSIYNWVWEEVDGVLVCKELIRLHPFTFRNAPSSAAPNNSYGRLLQGIYYDYTDKEIHYCQTQLGTGLAKELPRENLFVVKDPSDLYPDGESVVYPTIPLIDLLNYAWNTAGQQMFRIGAPIMFIKIENPQPERTINGITQKSDVDYAREILENWGKDTQYPLRQNMEVISIDVKEGSLAINTINKANETIRDYFSPVGMLGRDGSLIAGNQGASLKLINNYIKGWISLLENSLRELPNYYLQHNGYPKDWHAEVQISHNTFDDTTLKIQQAQVLYSTKTGTPNEIRELLGCEGVGSEELSQMRDEWDMLAGSSEVREMFSDSLAPSRASYTNRNKIARECEYRISDSINELTAKVLASAKLAEKMQKDKGLM